MEKTQTFKRGDKVWYCPSVVASAAGRSFVKPIETFVWASLSSGVLTVYFIQHPDGEPKQNFVDRMIFPRSFEKVNSSELNDGLNYIYAEPKELELSSEVDERIEHAKNIKGRLFYIDIDNTLCISAIKDADGELDYKSSIPIPQNIMLVNALHENNKIVLFTARGKRTGKINWENFTASQMKQWGVKFHDLDFNKPHWDLLIDDKAIANFQQLPNAWL